MSTHHYYRNTKPLTYTKPLTIANIDYEVEEGEMKRVLMWDGYSVIPGACRVNHSEVRCIRCRDRIALPVYLQPTAQIIIRVKNQRALNHGGLWIRSNFTEIHRCGYWIEPLTYEQFLAARKTLLNIIVLLDSEGESWSHLKLV